MNVTPRSHVRTEHVASPDATSRGPVTTWPPPPLSRILHRRPPQPPEHPRILHALLPPPLPDHLDLPQPGVAVVEQERHLAADLREGVGDARSLDAEAVARLADVFEVGEQLVFH